MVEKNAYHIILMDVMMPVFDSYETITRIHENISKESMPKIVAMTASAFKTDRDRSIQVGMDDFISKPIRFSELERILQEHSPVTGDETPEKRWRNRASSPKLLQNETQIDYSAIDLTELGTLGDYAQNIGEYPFESY